MKNLFLGLLITLFSLSFGYAHIAHADGGTVLGEGPYTTTVGLPIPIEGVEISGATGTVAVKLLVSSGSLSMSTTTGLTFTGDEEGDEIYFSGTLANVNAALATLTYTASSEGSYSLEVSLVEPGEVFFEGNDHLYEYISAPGGITWEDAETAAAALTRYGSSGYLATITSEEENDFVAARLGGAGWMGASDAGSEGTWEWVTGPETGDDFWIGDEGGAVVPGEYANWDSGSEPNDSGGNEDCAQFLAGGSGFWNDLPCSGFTLTGYVVEFGAPGDLPETGGETFTITAVDGPTISGFSPADNSVDVDRRTQLTVTLNENVAVGTGMVRLYQSLDDALARTVDITSGAVSGWGTDTIVIDFGSPLRSNTEYYVVFDDGLFVNADDGISEGFGSPTYLNFTTERSTSRAVPPIGYSELSILEAVQACSSGTVFGTVRIESDQAAEYLLSNNAEFLGSTWESFDGGEIVVPWDFGYATGEVSVHAFLRNTSSSSYLSDTAIVSPCVISEDDLNDEAIGDDEPSDDGDAALRTGPSPWNGEIEVITDVTGMTLIKGENYDTVYWLQNGKRSPFIRESIYFTWFKDFSDVKIVTDATLQTIPLGSPVLPKSGALLKIQSVADVYLVDEVNGIATLILIESEQEAAELFGKDWADLVMDLDVFLFNKFTIVQ